MAEPELDLAEARRQVRRIIDQLEAVRWQLLGLKLSLPRSPTEESQEDLSAEPGAMKDLRATLECVLADDIRPALQDLQVLVGGLTAPTEAPP
jgi:hypothetical protein